MGPYRTLVIGIVAAAGIFSAACKPKSEPAPEALPPAAPPPAPAAPTLVSIELGKAIQADKRAVNPGTVFGRRDTIYAAVTTNGTMPNANMTAKWTFQDGQVVDSSTQTVNLAGPATTEFHIAKASAWPAGKYKVEVTLNGNPLGQADFEIKR
jgi:hypothetical protein